MTDKECKKVEQILIEKSSSVSPETVHQFSNDQEKRKIAESKASSASILQDVKLILDFLQDYGSGKYTNTPWKAIASFTVAIAYLISPFDILPDFLIGVGLLDDIFLVGLTLRMFHSELEKYKQWRDSPEGKIRRTMV